MKSRVFAIFFLVSFALPSNAWERLERSFWEDASAPLKIGFVTGPDRTRGDDLFHRLVALDPLSIIDPFPQVERAGAADALVFLVPSWEVVRAVDDFGPFLPPEAIFDDLIAERRLIFYSGLVDDGRPLGIVMVVVNEETDNECLASVLYSTILAGFDYGALDYSKCP